MLNTVAGQYHPSFTAKQCSSGPTRRTCDGVADGIQGGAILGPSWGPGLVRNGEVHTGHHEFTGLPGHTKEPGRCDTGWHWCRSWSLNRHILLHVIYLYVITWTTQMVTGCEGICGPGKSTDRTCLQFFLQFIKIMMFCGLSPAIFSSLVSTSSGWVSGWCICAGSAPRTSRLPICRAWIGNTTDAMDVLTQVILNHEIQSRQYQILNLSFLI